MKNYVLLLSFIFGFSCNVFAAGSCFVAKEDDRILISEGDCDTQYPPQSTFKVALSLIGFDSGILKSEKEPTWTLPKDTDPYISVCKEEHGPRTWMRDSCLWYSKILTSKLGMPKFQSYIDKFSYGNKDLSGGLTQTWVSSSLKISPEEQVEFMQKIVGRSLPINKLSFNKTKKIMFIQDIAGGWKLYGKTGNGKQIDDEGNKTDLQHGWFVGYIQKGTRNIVFASHLVDEETEDTFASFRARNEALIKLWYIIDDLEK